MRQDDSWPIWMVAVVEVRGIGGAVKQNLPGEKVVACRYRPLAEFTVKLGVFWARLAGIHFLRPMLSNSNGAIEEISTLQARGLRSAELFRI